MASSASADRNRKYAAATVAGNGNAHRLAVIARGGQVVGRRKQSTAILAPDVELVRHLDCHLEIVAGLPDTRRQRRRGLRRYARASAVAGEIDARDQIRLREQHLRARRFDAGKRCAQIEVVGKRFVDQRGQHRILERGPPVLEQLVLRGGSTTPAADRAWAEPAAPRRSRRMSRRPAPPAVF
jgi:hypothetical protein